MPQGTPPHRSNSDVASTPDKKFRFQHTSSTVTPLHGTPSDAQKIKMQYESPSLPTSPNFTKIHNSGGLQGENRKSIITNCDVTKVTASTDPKRSVTTNLPSEKTGSGYVGIDSLQEQTRVKALRKGFEFNLMVAGRSGLGKSTLVNTLFQSDVSRRKPGEPEKIPSTTEIRSCSRTLSEGGVTLNLTITDTPGFGDHVNNENCWEPLVSYIESQYWKYMKEEQKVDRPKRIKDTRVHCVIYFIPPSGHELSSLDVEVLRRLERIVNVVPVVAKSDTLTLEERSTFKSRIKADLNDHGVRVYPVVEYEDEEDKVDNSKLRARLPFCVVGSTSWHESGGRRVLGRKCGWGLVEVENRQHSDFPFLRDMLIRTHMKDLMEITSFRHYETFRRNKLNKDILKDSNEGSNNSDELDELSVKGKREYDLSQLQNETLNESKI